MLRVGNFIPSISIEGFEEQNDGRRGNGHFEKVMHAMDLLKAHKLLFGTSICYTSKNYKTVTSDEFLDLLFLRALDIHGTSTICPLETMHQQSFFLIPNSVNICTTE